MVFFIHSLHIFIKTIDKSIGTLFELDIFLKENSLKNEPIGKSKIDLMEYIKSAGNASIFFLVEGSRIKITVYYQINCYC
jgi:hypothetical protein